MTRAAIPVKKLLVRSHQIWDDQWFLLTAGDFARGRYNTMTVSWGSLGTMWNLPFAQVVVRPSRYTYQFMEESDSFTLSAFPEERRHALDLLGTRSGRDGNKIAEAGLTPMASTRVAAPASPRPTWSWNAGRSTGTISIRAVFSLHRSPPAIPGRTITGSTSERFSPSTEIPIDTPPEEGRLGAGHEATIARAGRAAGIGGAQAFVPPSNAPGD